MVQRRRNAPLELGVLEIDDVVRLDLLHVVVLLGPRVLDELPQTLALVLVYDRRPLVVRTLNRRPVLHVVPSLVPLRQRTLLSYRRVQVNHRLGVSEVHETVSADVVVQQLVVEVDRIPVLLVTAVRVDLPNYLV